MGDAAGRPKVVIVGAGFGGLAAAQALGGTDVAVTVVDRLNYHLFQPMLYQVALAGLSATDVAYPIRRILRHHPNVEVLLDEVRQIDLATRRVQLADGIELAYDYLIVAAGAETSYFGHDDWSPVAPGLKDLDDAFEVRRRVLSALEAAERTDDPEEKRRLLTFVVVGGGPTGVELAGAIADLSRDILSPGLSPGEALRDARRAGGDGRSHPDAVRSEAVGERAPAARRAGGRGSRRGARRAHRRRRRPRGGRGRSPAAPSSGPPASVRTRSRRRWARRSIAQGACWSSPTAPCPTTPRSSSSATWRR